MMILGLRDKAYRKEASPGSENGDRGKRDQGIDVWLLKVRGLRLVAL
jgi:hypothetical protein